jgi:hypothetical protein
MTWRDKLEIGLKDDARFRKDNLPESQVRGPQIPAGPHRSPEIPMARDDRNEVLDSDAPVGTSGLAPEATETDAEAAATTEGMPPREPDRGDAGVGDSE